MPPSSVITVAHTLSEEEIGQINAAQNSNTNPYPCVNNTDETCLNGPGISYAPDGYDNTKAIATFQPSDQQTIKQIMGTVMQADNKSIIIKTSTGKSYNLQTPDGTLDGFYQNKGKDYNITSITGRTLLITYTEQPEHHSQTIQPAQLIGALLITDPDQ